MRCPLRYRQIAWAIARRLADLGYISIGDQPAEFAAHIKAEIERLAKILR